MAAAPLLRQHVLPLAGLTTALALYPKRSTSAEEAPAEPIRTRKPIYPSPNQPTTPPTHTISATTPPPASGETTYPSERTQSGPTGPRAPTPTDRLASQIKKSRLFLHTYAARAEDAVNGGMDRVMDAEHNFTSTIASLAPGKETNEKLLPGGIYVLVATMFGSIISRNRNILLRLLTPTATGIIAANYFVPVTTRNVGDLIWRYEERVPVVRDNHLRISRGVRDLVEVARTQSVRGARVADEKVQEARQTMEDWVKKGR